MSMPFKLSVPVDHRFRGLVADVTAKCVELAGGTAADGQSLAEALAASVNGMSPDAHAQVELQFRPSRGGVDVIASCGGRTATVHHAIPVSRS